MQEAAIEHWLSFDDFDSEIELGDFGFALPESYVFDSCQMAVLSNFQLLPRAGGYDDQDYLWTQDLKTYLRGLAWARQQKHGKPKSEIPNDASDWTTY